MRVLLTLSGLILLVLMNNCDHLTGNSYSKNESSFSETLFNDSDDSGLGNSNGGGYTGTIPFINDPFFSAAVDLECNDTSLLLSTLDYLESKDSFEIKIITCNSTRIESLTANEIWRASYSPHFLYARGRIWLTGRLDIDDRDPYYLSEVCFNDEHQVSFSIKYSVPGEGVLDHTLFTSEVIEDGAGLSKPVFLKRRGRLMSEPDGRKTMTTVDGDITIELLPEVTTGKRSAIFQYEGSAAFSMNCLTETIE